MDNLHLRLAVMDDLPEMLNLFRDTILHVNIGHYSQEQVLAWSDAANHWERWVQKMQQQHVLLAFEQGKLVGFGSLRNDYIDLLYVHKDHQGKGIASALYNVLEGRARELGMQALATDASFNARPFFERKGFIFVVLRDYVLNGVEISNCRMIKSLH
jgi:putative acetyltransferase